MVSYSRGTGGVGLVDVYSLDWAAESYRISLFWGGGGSGIDGFSADGVVEDEDFGGAGSGAL